MKKEKLKSRMLMSIHDGIVGEGPASEMVMLKQLADKYLASTIGKGAKKVPLAVDFDMFNFWYGKKLSFEDLKSYETI
jgi:DNA polymerase I-like protein with 3'-5' exonuclease and polymerase domains